MTSGGRSAGLAALLAPRSIAVVGASRDPAKWGRRVLEYSQRAGYAGRLYGVTPVTADLGLPGVSTVPSLAAIDGQVDLAVIARPAAAVPAVIAECAAAGVGAALVTAAGFGELGGAALTAERDMIAAARRAGLRVLGPNTFGIFVADQGVNVTPREEIPAGSVALLTQSGNVAVALYELARQAGIGFSACVGVGNQADVDFGDLLGYFAADPATAAIAVYAEGLRGSGTSLRAGLAACAAAGKPVVILKSGRSAGSARAVATHTGALAADDRLWQAVLDQAGAVRVASTSDLVDTLALVTSVPRNAGRVMVLTDGGGDSVLAADALADAGLSLAVPSAATRAALDKLVPPDAPRVPDRNPVTLDTAGGVEDDPELLSRCVAAAAADDGVDVIMIGGLFGGYPRMLDSELACAAELAALHAAGRPVVIQSAFAASDSPPVAALRQAGLAVLPDVSRLARALAATARPAPGTGLAGLPASAAGPGHPRPAAGAPATGPQLPAAQAATLLRSYGITLPEITLLTSPAQLAAAAPGAAYPAVLKVADPAITHKSDVGGVRLRLAGPADLTAAGDELWQRFPGSPLLVMPFLAAGQELLVGTGTDPVFGPYVLVGRGGIWAETDPDVTLRLAPASEQEALDALLSLRCAATLTGGRGTRPADLAALATLVSALSRLGADHPELSVEMNPVIAYPDGYAVADLRACSATPLGELAVSGSHAG
ncbi:MAG TPA: acetate--CoA ligase family protein [Streptosporangiaceae bacterium]